MSPSNYSELTDKIFFRIYSNKRTDVGKIFGSVGYVCLTDVQHVSDFDHSNDYLEAVTLPTQDPNFKCVDIHNMWYANKIDFDKKLNLNEVSTFNFLIDNGLSIDQTLVFACKQGYLDIVVCLIESGANIYFNNDLPIKTATMAGHLHVVKYLFDHGLYQGRNNDTIIKMSVSWDCNDIFDYVFVRSSNINIDEILETACNFYRLHVIKYIINSGYQPYQTCHARSFEWMCHNGDVDVVKKFITNGIDVRENSQAIIRAVMQNKIDVVKLLIENGADVQVNNNHALECACTKGNLSIVQLLINHGANFRFDNDHALREAAKYGQMHVVKYLVEIGCNIRINNDHVLRQAARYGDLELINIFISLGVDVITNQGVLKNACDAGKFDIIKYIVEQITDASYDYYDAIQIVSQRGYFNIFTYLLSKVLDAATITDVIIYLSSLGNLDMIKYVFENKKDIGNIDEALSNAICNGHLHVIKYLIEKGANVKLDLSLKTHFESKILQSISYLIEIGIDIHLVNSVYAIECAACYGYLDIIKYFVNKENNIQSHLDDIIKCAISGSDLNIVKFFF